MDGNLCTVARYLEDSDDWDFVSSMPVALRFVLSVQWTFTSVKYVITQRRSVAKSV